jgi:hypothetical protein
MVERVDELRREGIGERADDGAMGRRADGGAMAKREMVRGCKGAMGRRTTASGRTSVTEPARAGAEKPATLSARPAADICKIVHDSFDSPEITPAKLAEELGLLQSTDEDETARWVDQALAANERAVQDALSNPKKAKSARGFLTGQVMKLSGGKADPKLAGALIGSKLDEIAGEQSR